MVKINSIIATKNYVDIEFQTDVLTISTRVYGDLEPQQIVETGYGQVKPYVELMGGKDHELPQAIDEVLNIEILGVENINFTQGQAPFEKTFRCAGHTLYGKTLKLEAEWENQTLTINPTADETHTVKAKYGNFTDQKTFTVTYIIPQPIEPIPETPQEEIKRLINEIEETDYKIIKCSEYQLAGKELPYDITILHAERQAKRNRINELQGGKI